MKETTSELVATVVVILAIGVFIAFFYYTLWPLIKDNFNRNSQCSKAICDSSTLNDGYVECHLKGDTIVFKCIYKG